MPGSGNKLYCECSTRCRGGKWVSRSTYYLHKQAQPQLSTTINQFAASTNSEARTTHAHGLSGALGNQDAGSTDVGPGHGTSENRSKRRRLDGTDESDIDAEQEGSSGNAVDDATENNPNSPRADFGHGGSGSLPPDMHHHDPPSRNTDTRRDPGCLRDINDLDNPDNRSGVRAPTPEPEPEPDHPPNSRIEDIQIALEFIDAIKRATLDNSGLDPDVITRLRSPPQKSTDFDDPDLRHSLDLFLSDASRETYNNARAADLRHHPEDKILSYDAIKRRVADETGVVPLVHDMCINSCVAFTGPYSHMDKCPKCSECRYDQIKLAASDGKNKVPRQKYYTIPIGPQIQALYRSKESAQAMRYREEATQKVIEELRQNGGRIPSYCDFLHGEEYLKAVRDGIIKPGDTVLMLSLDGAQLYRHKSSDCWIYIWVILDLSPDLRYKKKHVLTGGVIPGPNKPKNLDSFLFPGLHHLSALQREGLRIWDALEDKTFDSNPFLALITADGPGMTYLNGLVGHHGAYGCRLYCPLKSRHKHGVGHYYPALLKPIDYDIEGCDHDDINVRSIPPPSSEEYIKNLKYVQESRNETQYKMRRKDTGISKPSILSGLPRALSLPGLAALDLMHLIALNDPDLFLGLWRGTIDCDDDDDKSTWDWATLVGSTWKDHGQTVANARPYLPGSFDTAPRNPAEKVSSGYKAWEYLIYMFGLGPGLLRGLIPDKYWRHYCKLVRAVRILHQRSITADERVLAHMYLLEFTEEFEDLYYQRKLERLHFCRPCLHTHVHLAPEVHRVGPLCYYTQWTMERTIGNLGEEIKQPSNPYANLSERGLRRSQVNALKAMIPDLEGDDEGDRLPRGAEELGDGYVLLGAKDNVARSVREPEARAIQRYVEEAAGTRLDFDLAHLPSIKIVRWARLRLPNGQIARSAWKEKLKCLEDVRMARNVKLRLNGKIHFAEVLYYMHAKRTPEDLKDSPMAVVSLFSAPDPGLLERSYGTVWSCKAQGDADVRVIDVKNIMSVVAMVPDSQSRVLGDLEGDRYFVVEKPGLEIASMGGVEEELTEE